MLSFSVLIKLLPVGMSAVIGLFSLQGGQVGLASWLLHDPFLYFKPLGSPVSYWASH